MTTEWLRFFLAIFATYRLAQFLPYDDGPLFVFKRIRDYADFKARVEQDKGKHLGKWNNLNEGIHCPLCAGLYISILMTELFLKPKGWENRLLMILAIAGGQSAIERVSK